MNRKEELQKYLRETANPLLERLVSELLKERPKGTALAVFCRDWFQKEIANHPPAEHSSEDEPEEVLALPQPSKPKTKNRRAVSAEVYG
jgi:hypothetical protein